MLGLHNGRALIALTFVFLLSGSPSQAEIIVATAGPITGQLAALGEQYAQGARKAVEEINKAGGILGERLVLEIGDDACDPKQAVNVANQLASRGVQFVAGHLCSSSSIPASKVYEEEGILQITPGSNNPKLTEEGGWNVARSVGRDDAQGQVAGQLIAQNYSGKRIAIVDDKSAFGVAITGEVRRAMNAAGLVEAMNESINAGEKDYSALVSTLKSAGVEVVYFGGHHPEAGRILMQMNQQGSSIPFIATDAMSSPELWAIAGNAAENMIFTLPPEPRNFPAAKAIVEEFRADGYEPEGYTLYTYAAFQMYQQAATATGGFDNKKIAEWLRSGNAMSTVVGDIVLDSKGDVINAKYTWGHWKGGTLEIIEKPPPTCPYQC